MKRNKNIILLLITIVLFVLMVFMLYKLFTFDQKYSKTPIIEDKKTESTISEKINDDIIFSLIDFKYYEYNDFNFIIADINFKSESKKISVILEELKTSENIQLSSIKEYTSKLEQENYFIVKSGVDFKIESSDNVVDARLFIPVTKNTNYLSLLYKNQKIDFNNINLKKADINLLKDNALVFTDNKSYRLKFIGNFDASSSQMFMKDLEYNSPSTVKTYAFELELENIGNNIVNIEQAYFIDEESKEKFKVLDRDFSNEKYLNLFNLDVVFLKQGCLFIEAYNPVQEPINYQGKLFIKLNTSEKIIEIPTELNKGDDNYE